MPAKRTQRRREWQESCSCWSPCRALMPAPIGAQCSLPAERIYANKNGRKLYELRRQVGIYTDLHRCLIITIWQNMYKRAETILVASWVFKFRSRPKHLLKAHAGERIASRRAVLRACNVREPRYKAPIRRWAATGTTP